MWEIQKLLKVLKFLDIKLLVGIPGFQKNILFKFESYQKKYSKFSLKISLI